MSFLVKAAKAVATIALDHIEQAVKPDGAVLCLCGHSRAEHCGCGRHCSHVEERSDVISGGVDVNCACFGFSPKAEAAP